MILTFRKFAFFAFALAMSSSLVGQTINPPLRKYINGNQLSQYCSGNEIDPEVPLKRALCQTYVLGVVDAHESMAILGIVKRQFCLPEGTLNAKLTNIAMKYLQGNPEKLKMTAAFLVLVSLKDAFPCVAR